MALGLFELVALLLVVVVYVASLSWVHGDALARGVRQPVLLTLTVGLVSWPLGLVLWLLFRPDEDDPFEGVLEPGDDPLL